MPELPEVETIVRELQGALAGKTLSRFSVRDTKKIASPKLLLPQKISSVERHGKYIVLRAGNGTTCLVHLRMTGELLFERLVKKNMAQKHERAVFHFDDKSALRFLDVRRFGTVDWLRRGDALPELGVDPLSPAFNEEIMSKLLKNSTRAIKSFLLDQQKIAGIGNIYADEALWMAKVHPARRSGSLKAAEIRRLALAIKNVLREGIRKGGFTLRDYRRIDGSFGYYQKSRKVYDREEEGCLRCSTVIKRMKVGGRSSYFCPACQKKL